MVHGWTSGTEVEGAAKDKGLLWPSRASPNQNRSNINARRNRSKEVVSS